MSKENTNPKGKWEYEEETEAEDSGIDQEANRRLLGQPTADKIIFKQTHEKKYIVI